MFQEEERADGVDLEGLEHGGGGELRGGLLGVKDAGEGEGEVEVGRGGGLGVAGEKFRARGGCVGDGNFVWVVLGRGFRTWGGSSVRTAGTTIRTTDV